VNLGGLPASGKAYLFVFDADNNHNSKGYPVMINYAEDETPPAAPPGLKIANIAYFDNEYIDTTWSRVTLADEPNYSNATIIEPQIPSAWSDDSITRTVNLGRLSNERAYLFVFDEDNNHNSEGYSVMMNYSEEETEPAAPTGLKIVEIEYK
jgi:hypothetical protein